MGIVGESINLGENFVQRGARRVIRVEGEIILQSSACKAEVNFTRDNTNQVKEPDSNSDFEYIDSVTAKPENFT